MGSYELIRNVFRWLALALLAYVGSAVLAKPDPWRCLAGPSSQIQFSAEFLAILVAVIGTTLSAYLYTWQSNVEVEEEIVQGRTRLEERKGACDEELRKSGLDIVFGMLFSNLIMYSIILSTARPCTRPDRRDRDRGSGGGGAAAAGGRRRRDLVRIGVIGVGFLAVPIMTTGAAYDLCQVLG